MFFFSDEVKYEWINRINEWITEINHLLFRWSKFVTLERRGKGTGVIYLITHIYVLSIYSIYLLCFSLWTSVCYQFTKKISVFYHAAKPNSSLFSLCHSLPLSLSLSKVNLTPSSIFIKLIISFVPPSSALPCSSSQLPMTMINYIPHTRWLKLRD